MQPEHIIAFNITLLAAMASPGPALVVAIRTVLSAGGRAGMAIGCGLGIAAAGWTLAALVGLDAVFTLFPWSYVLVKIVGGLYLSYLAYRIWKAAPQPVAEAEIPPGHAILAATMSRQAVRTRYFAMKLYLDRFAAVVLQVLAINILFTLW